MFLVKKKKSQSNVNLGTLYSYGEKEKERVVFCLGHFVSFWHLWLPPRGVKKLPEGSDTNLGLPTKQAISWSRLPWRGFADFLPWVPIMSCLLLWNKGSRLICFLGYLWWWHVLFWILVGLLSFSFIVSGGDLICFPSWGLYKGLYSFSF